MSIFGKLRRAKQAADSQKGKNAAGADSKPPPAPYKHTPTHAAADALLGAPGTWREEDKKAIQAQHHKRRSNLNRNQSSLSNVTTLNRDQSFTSTEWGHASDQRKHNSLDWASTAKAPQRSQPPPVGRANYSRASQFAPSQRSSTPNFSGSSQLPPSEPSSTTKLSRASQLPPSERSHRQSNIRRSRFETAEPAPPALNGMESRHDGPYPSLVAPSKDVKFYLPSSRGELSRDRS